MNLGTRLTLVIALAISLFTAPAHADHIRDLCDVVGARDNQLSATAS